jgi:solute carrier family 45, member 1/2/4
LGVTLLDFAADSSDSPLRAFLLDSCNSRDQETGLNIHAFLGGTGSALGYILGGIDFTKFTSLINLFGGDETRILFVLSTFLFFLPLIVTLTSCKEKQFILNNIERLPLLEGKKDFSFL